MRNFYKLIGLFVVLLIAVLALFSSSLDDVEEDIKITKNQIRGVEFIKEIQLTTMNSESYYILLQFQDSKYFKQLDDEIKMVKHDLNQSLEKLNKLIVVYPEYQNKELKESLDILEGVLRKKDKSDLRDFERIDSALKYLRADNYRAGDISTLHYEGEKDIYLFASIMTHYMPEFIGELSKARALIVQGLLNKNFNIDLRNEIVHSISLFSLSKEEIEQIVQMIKDDYDSGDLQSQLNSVNLHVSDIKNISDEITKEKHISLDPMVFYEMTNEIRSLSINIHNENVRLLSKTLQIRKTSLEDKVLYMNLLFGFISIVGFSSMILMFFSTRSTLSKELFASNLLRQSQDAVDAFTLVCKIDKNGLISYVNMKFCEVSGYLKEELIGQPYEAMLAHEGEADIFKTFVHITENEHIWMGKMKSLRKDGKTFYMDTHINPIFDSFNKIVEYIVIGSDITELTRMKEKLESDLTASNAHLYEAYMSANKQKKLLEDQKELYELVFKNTDSSVLIIDIKENKFIDCNEPAIEILKCNGKEDVLDLQPAQLSPTFQPDGRRSDEKSDEMNKIAIEKGFHTFEWKHVNKLGEEFWVEVVLTHILLDHKNVLHVVWKDINDHKEAEKERAEQQMVMIQQSRFASMGEMIGNISHQWRQPLNALGLILQKLIIYKDRDMLSDKLLKENIDKSMNLIFSMSTTIDDFRDFFNPNKEKSDFLISDAITKAYMIVESSLEHASIEYKVEMDNKELRIDGYMNEFSQVLVNLLNNAKDILIEREVDPARIVVKVTKDDNHVLISICDNAGGVPASVLPKIFDPYFTTKEEGKGTGIGLYMSKMIIEDHMHGKLDCLNIDDSACFEIRLSSV